MKNISLLMLTMLSSFWLIAQERSKEAILEKGTFEEVRSFIDLGGGIGLVSFRDLATSPLIYRGTSIDLKLAYTKQFLNKEYKIGIDYFSSSTFSSVEGETSFGSIQSIDLNYNRLYSLKSLSFRGWQSKVGGTISVLAIQRLNTDLSNNALGLDFFPTLFGSFKIGKDFTKYLPFRKKKGARHQHFSIQLDVGLINTNFRNGYAYTIHSPLYNEPDSLFVDYQFNLFSGLRIRSTVDYILYAKNTKNAIKLSYNWAGVRSGENPNRFALSNGLLSFSLLYRLNK